MDKESLIAFEKRMEKLFLDKKINFPIHFSGKGNEDFLIKLFKEIDSDDYVFSNHRNHYHALLKGIPEKELEYQIIKNGSMHIYSREHNFFTSAIVGGCLPIALGVAMAIKRKKQPNKVWIFIGDMGSSMGIFCECTEYASRHNLPIIFIVEDNGLSVDTPTQEVWGSEKRKTNIIHYEYKRGFPHVGSDTWVSF